jgi:hypothetical protein
MAPAAAPARPAAGGSGLNKKIGGVPTWAYGLVAVAIIGGVMYVRHKNSAAAAAAAAANGAGSTSGTQMATTPYQPVDTSGAIGSDTLAAILASQGAGSTASQSTPAQTNYTPPANEVAQGGGYMSQNRALPISDSAGNQYVQINSAPPAKGQPSAASEAQASGQTLYYQPVPGIFLVAPSSGPGVWNLAGGTPLFVRAN